MKRRQAIGILGGVAAGPLVMPSAAFAELLDWSQRVRRSGATSATPSLLTPPRTRVMAALAEVIIPATDTPGASEAGVTEFVAALVDGWLDDNQRDRFLAGLDTMDPAARERFGADFADCTAGQQSQYVGDLDAELTRLRQDPNANASPPLLPRCETFHNHRLLHLGGGTGSARSPYDLPHLRGLRPAVPGTGRPLTGPRRR